MIDRADSADSNEPALAAEPMEKADATEPTEPIDRTDPTEPIESTDPFDPMHRIEFSDRIDHSEPRFVNTTNILPHGMYARASGSACTGVGRYRPGASTRGRTPRMPLSGRRPRRPAGGRAGSRRCSATTRPSARVDLRFHLFRVVAADRIGEPVDTWEAERVDWLPLADVRRAIRGGEVSSGMTLTGLLYHFAEVG